jgi:hypothetical protein
MLMTDTFDLLILGSVSTALAAAELRVQARRGSSENFHIASLHYV